MTDDAQTHKPWCSDHKSEYEDSCFTQVVLYDNGDEEEAKRPEDQLPLSSRHSEVRRTSRGFNLSQAKTWKKMSDL